MAKRSPYETGELSDSIFLILLATLEPVYGYRIMQSIEESTDGAVKVGPATMYTTLKKLKQAGWIVETAEDDKRILYAATDEGRAVLERDFARRKRLVAFAEDRLNGRGEEDHG
ncbi:PadR family transcriptional regulator [Gordonibacter massiliensis (ex Traore et al. 2017)]|uniref:PadR family transcriptional regulator n=1 Tax=Gordonibacter massiliensis (ex Traore et al. 2017) TaxID=1841863 RepID=UPI001C8C98FA|nr:PadR family transcriptional regulator [Gordonibacter massiliensis (ex Traore et al. 2017)]MBX9033252.1 helix-turn-helix transcriptional regulator [Gordonibacter massiliensis (ex Traore et al. 2017)]